ncbi:MAG: hypothetical protein ABEJ70_08720 [Halobacteriaceae archaeon]
MSDDTARSTGERPSAVPSAGAGLAAWLAGYALTYALTAPRVRASLVNRLAQALSGEATTWRVVGWIFYNAHVVDTRIEAGIFGSGAVNFVGGDSFSPLLYALPPVVLVAAGALAARVADVDRSGAAVALATAPLVGGYLLLTVAGLVAFPVVASGASAGPDPVAAVVLAGLVYPAVFGGVGVTLGAWTGGGARSRGTR